MIFSIWLITYAIIFHSEDAHWCQLTDAGLNGPKVMVTFWIVAVTFLQMEYLYLLRFSVIVFISDFFFLNNSFSIFFPIPIRRSNVRGISPKLIEFLLLLLCEHVVKNRHWRVRVLPRAGWDWQGGCRKLLIPAWASSSTEHVVSSPSALPPKPQHFACKKREKIKDRREKNVLSERFRRSVRRLVLKLSRDHSVPSIAAAAQWKNHINKTSPDLLYMKASRNFQHVLLPHSCLLLHGVSFSWCDPNLKAVGATPGCAVASSLPLLRYPVLQQQIPGSPEGKTAAGSAEAVAAIPKVSQLVQLMQLAALGPGLSYPGCCSHCSSPQHRPTAPVFSFSLPSVSFHTLLTFRVPIVLVSLPSFPRDTAAMIGEKTKKVGCVFSPQLFRCWWFTSATISLRFCWSFQ